MPTQQSSGLLRFFFLALGFTWLLQLPLVLVQRGLIAGSAERFMPFAALGTLGPLIAAIVASRTAPGGVRALLRRILIWRVGAGWYVAALAGFGVVYVASRAVYGLSGGTDAAWLYLPENAQHVAAMVMIPIVEETGWRGFAQPRLQQRHGAVRASLILGALWAAWHVMMFASASTSWLVFAVSIANILVGAFAFTWLFNRTQGSLLLAVIAHMGAHLNNPSHGLPGVAPMMIYTLGLALVVAALLLFDRKAWPPAVP